MIYHYERFLELKDKVPNQWDIFEKYWKSNEQVKNYKFDNFSYISYISINTSKKTSETIF